jgi:cell division protein ZapA
MGQINVTIGGRSYPLACRDGEEARLEQLAAHINAKAGELSTLLGQLSEPRLLLMSAILTADELFELRDGSANNESPPPADTNRDADLVAQITETATRIEAIATRLEQRAASA